MTKHSKQFGFWPSDVSPERVAEKSLRFGMVQSAQGYIYWTECRPDEQGRCVIMRRKIAPKNDSTHKPVQKSDQYEAEELLPAPFSARSSVHEYGGGEFLVSQTSLYFINADDQQIYHISLADTSKVKSALPSPHPVTNKPHHRFTDMTIDQAHHHIICVAEIHRPSASDPNNTGIEEDLAPHPENCLALIDLSVPLKERMSILVSGHDFYANPRLSPDGKQIAWLSWNLPHMPWESAALYLGELDTDWSLEAVSQIVGDGTTAVFQPQWHSDGSLYFIWDKTGWGNLYRWNKGQNITDVPDHLIDMPAEFGDPLWNFGIKKYAILGNGDLALSFYRQGQTCLGLFHPNSRQFSEVSLTEHDLTSLGQVVATAQGIAALAHSHTQPQAIIEILLDTDQYLISNSTPLRKSSDIVLSPQNISKGLPIKFQNDRNQNVFAVFYPPVNADYTGDQNTQPPCVFNVHGGPTAAVSRGLNVKIQYWTNRGFAFCDVDYSGSTGYGKAYRQRLDGLWGIADVDDLISAAHFLIEDGKVNQKQCVITGGSAGGLTVLNALAKSAVFVAGASYYGVTDLLKLQQTTHKFEADYLFGLIGCTEQNYREILPPRSPFTQADKIDSPVIFFQGTKDQVVPLEQAKTMSKALEKRNIPTKLFIFEGEGHGFRQSETIITTLKEELSFYTQLFMANE